MGERDFIFKPIEDIELSLAKYLTVQPLNGKRILSGLPLVTTYNIAMMLASAQAIPTPRSCYR